MAVYRGGAVNLARCETVADDLNRVLHEEIGRLPKEYRAAVNACYVEGKSQTQAAAQMCVSETTIRGRLARARMLLKRRLTLRDVYSSGMFYALGGSKPCDGLITRGMIAAVARAAVRVLNQEWNAHGIRETLVGATNIGDLFAMIVRRLKTAVAVGTVSLAIASAGVLLVRPVVSAQAHGNAESDRQETSASADLPAVSALAPVSVAYQQEAKGNTKRRKQPAVDPELAKLVDGSIVRSAGISKDCMILSYLPAWDHGNVDNIGMGNNDGGNRMLIEWPAVPADEASAPDNRFMIAVYSRETISHPPAGPIHAFEITEAWEERTSWNNRPRYDPEPVATYRFEKGNGWRLFDITALVRAQAKPGRNGHGVMFRFVSEELPGPEHSDYKCVSREATGEWQSRRPVLLVVKTDKP